MSMLSRALIRGVEEIGTYQILDDLGPAPLGSLYAAVDTRSDRKTLLKVIPPSRPGALQDAAPWEILLAETRALFRIYHRGIPRLLDLAEVEGSLVIALEPVEGITLHEHLGSGRHPDRALLIDWGCQLLEALAEAHAQGVVHRHISEAQIVLSPGGRLLLTGFGLTQLFFDPLLASPSDLFPPELPDRHDDVRAVGLLLGRLAFGSGLKGGSAGAGRDPLLKVVARATFPDPETRFQDALEMIEALRQAAAAAPPSLTVVPPPKRGAPSVVAAKVESLPPRPPVEPTEAEDRRFALVLLGAVLVVMLTVIAAGWLLLRHGSPPVAPSHVLPLEESSSKIPHPHSDF